MKAWWAGRTVREQLLLGVCAGLMGLLIISQAILGPLFRAHTAASASYARASADLAYVHWAAERVTTSAGAARPRSTQSVRAIVGATQGGAGVVVNAVTPAGEDEASVRLDAVPPAALYAWLTSLQRDHGVVVVRGNIRRGQQGGAVSANLTLAKEG